MATFQFPFDDERQGPAGDGTSPHVDSDSESSTRRVSMSSDASNRTQNCDGLEESSSEQGDDCDKFVSEQDDSEKLTLMSLPHEIILKVIEEVILDDRKSGCDHIRTKSSTYALSRTSGFWQKEVEARYEILWLATNLFPGFAKWSAHCDWLFFKGRFAPLNETAEDSTTGKSTAKEIAAPTMSRYRTQSSLSVENMIVQLPRIKNLDTVRRENAHADLMELVGVLESERDM